MSKRKSVMTHQFSQVPAAEIPRSSFDRSHGYKTAFDGGLLVPILVDEVLPGDTFNVKLTALARLATPIFPTMDNMFMETFFFAVPMRLIWDNWQKFNGEQDNPGDSTDFLIPTMSSTPTTGYLSGELSDYFGIPTGVPDLVHSSLWHRAYALIWNEWFRDQNLSASIDFNTGDGPDDASFFTLQRRAKRHDYFTSGLPWPQKGDSVDLPLGTTAPVMGDPATDLLPTFNIGGSPNSLRSGTSLGNNTEWSGTPGVAQDASWAEPKLVADLTNATAATINQLRQAFQTQKMLERDARGGTRYTEVIRAHFGVTSPDARLQRPEFLGGGSTPIVLQQVEQNTASNIVPDISPQGNLAAYGTAVLNNHGFTKSFTEHCLIIGLVNVRADLTYQQGLNRMFSRQTRFDHYWPALSHIGEQTILNKEIFAQGSVDLVADDAVFAYQERYAEFRYKPSQITGKLRSSDPETLDAWHLAQDFASLPVLGSTFIEDNPPIDRIIAVPSEPHFIFDGYFNMRCARPMPVYGVPGMIDHF